MRLAATQATTIRPKLAPDQPFYSRDRRYGRLIELRDLQPGDMGWVIQRHGEIYAAEYGWDMRFEALVAEIAAAFVKNLKPKREKCWIAERDGMRIGCVYLVERSKTIAQLRLLLVEPEARGLGLGQWLVNECIDFARAAGYRKMRLWTNDVLVSARRIYIAAGFELIEEESHASWGKPLTSQTWELKLTRKPVTNPLAGRR